MLWRKTWTGLPGMLLAIVLPLNNYTLLDSNGKKTRFLFQVKTELSLSNVEIIQSRVEQYQRFHGFDLICSRAFSALDMFLTLSEPLLKPEGRFFAMKGQRLMDEEQQVPERFSLLEVRPLQVAGLGERHLYIYALKADNQGLKAD